MSREPSFEELEKLVKEGRCLNCGNKPVAMYPMYSNPRPDILGDMRRRFTKEQVDYLLENGGICLSCGYQV